MAKDDYHVIVYQILSYLYQMLKKGQDVDGREISHKSSLFQINKKYWTYIIYNLKQDGFIVGLSFERNVMTDEIEVYDLDDCQITPKGIEYLTENSTIEKAKRFFKDVKEMTPFI